MSGAFTAKTMVLKGDPKKPESAQHIIIFPGGSVEISRTSNNEYWVHVEVHKGPAGANFGIKEGAVGEISETRIDYDYPRNEINSMGHESEIKHLAVKIKTRKGVD